MDHRITDRSQRVESYLNALIAGSRAPGIQYAVVDSTRTVFEYAGGWADIARGVPLDRSTSMMAYSMSKTITAAAVLQLVESGRITLDDPIDRYVDFSPYGPGVTVRQLLSHTSGIPNPVPLRWVHPASQHDSFDEDSALRAELQHHPRLASAPGSRFRYSNIGYWLLGVIVEQAGGQPFTGYVDEHVFRRLGASPSELGYRVADSARHAQGYLEKYSVFNLFKGFLIDRALFGEYEGRWLRIQPHYTNGAAFGGIVGSARGFGRFLQDQLRDRSSLFDQDARALFYAQQRSADGRPVAMTLGWHVGVPDGERFYYKEGGGGGFHAMMRLYPGAGLATVAMTNATGFNVKRLLNTVDPHFLREEQRSW